MKKRNVILGGIITSLLIAAVLSLTVFLRGVVLTYLWEWFVTPFFEVRAIGLAEAIGLSLMFIHLTHPIFKNSKDDDDKFSVSLTPAILYPLAVLSFGWFIKSFL